MITGEVVVATAALCAASSGFVAAGVAPHFGRRPRRSTDVGGEVVHLPLRSGGQGPVVTGRRGPESAAPPAASA